MTIDVQQAQWIINGLMGLVLWFGKRTLDATERRLDQLSLDVTNVKMDYLHKNEFKDFKMELRALFDELKTDIKGLRNAE